MKKKFNAVKFPIVLIALILGAQFYGVIGLAAAMSLMAFFFFLISTKLVFRCIKTLTFKEFYKELKYGIYPSIFMVFIIYIFQSIPMPALHHTIQLIIEAAIGGLSFLGIGLIFYKAKWVEFFEFVKLMKK